MCKYTVFILFSIMILIIFIILDNTKSIDHFSNPVINANPVNIIDNFITRDECNSLIEMSKNRFQPSTIYSSASGSIDLKSRSSTNVYFKKSENILIEQIEEKISNLLQIDIARIEPLQIAKYNKDQEYKLHYDYFDSNSNQFSNQRTHSVIIYLNDLDIQDGGSTFFSLYKIRFFPYQGRAIYWNNSDQDGKLNNLSLHCGEPVLTDKTKYILTIWIRKDNI